MSLSQEGDSLSEDEIFNLLSSARRRSVLRRLLGDDEPVELQELADEIAAEENDKAVGELTDRERKRVYVSLYQTHVPTMADAGVLDYEPESGSIVPRGRVAQLQGYLTPEETRSLPRLVWHKPEEQRNITWQLANAGLAVTGFAALVIAFTSPTVDLVTNVGAVALGALGAVSFAILAARWTLEEFGHTRRPETPRPGVWKIDDATNSANAEYSEHLVDSHQHAGQRGVSQIATEHGSDNRRTDLDDN